MHTSRKPGTQQGFVLVCTQVGSWVLCWCARNRAAGFRAGVHTIGKQGFVLVCTQGGIWVMCWCAPSRRLGSELRTRVNRAGVCAGVHASGKSAGFCAGVHPPEVGAGFCVGVHATGKLAPVLVCTHVGRGFCAGVHTIGKLDLNGGVTQCDATGNALVCTQGGSLVLCWCACNREAWFYAGVHARGKLGSVPRPSDRHSTLCRRQATFPVGFNTGLPTALATRQQASLALSI